MLQIHNQCPLLAQLLLFPNEDGVDCAYAVIKGTFRFAPKVVLAKEQMPVLLADQHWGEPGVSSVKYASDASLIKPAADVFVLGHAHAPQGKPATQVDVKVSVGSLTKTVRVIGDRTWKKGMLGASASAPQPFERMPLTYERAFGGTDRSREKEGTLESEPRNPVGTGFLGKKSSASLDGVKLPNLEDPKDLISSAKSRPKPMGFGPLAPSWDPRCTFVGTYDDAWQKSRSPYLPKDFNPKFFNAAAPDMILANYLQGGEAVVLENLTPDGMARFALPQVKPKATLRIAGTEHDVALKLDTLTLEPDLQKFALVWRGMVPCDKKTLKIQSLRVQCDGLVLE